MLRGHAPSRRQFVMAASAVAIAAHARPAAAWMTLPDDRMPRLPGAPVPAASPLPLADVALKPSLFDSARTANRAYLLSLDPDRLLHNFYVAAGLPPRGDCYGGWEAQGIAGHSVGHWLSACSILVASTGDADLRAKVDHAVAAMARIQAAHGDGYLGGGTVPRDGRPVDSKIVFEEVRRGDIRTLGWDLNGGWVPVYTLHKIMAGLIDAHQLAGNAQARGVVLALGGYFGTIVEGLDDEQVQRLLRCEHGGINESYAQLYALTGDRRWLAIAEKLRHRAVLDPLTAGQDVLAGLHANTQIPKVIGVARVHEVTGNPAHAQTARFFHDRVTHHHSYVIGGNSEREHFGAPDQLADRLSNATCEACNSYNMLKLTRHLFGWQPDAALFDYYERVQFNHMLAHQRPDTGMFAYFMPLESGARRDFSTPTDSFWCCVGSGMESHAKHADSIYWQGDDTLYVNLFIPSRAVWHGGGMALDLDTRYPMAGEIALTVRTAPEQPRTLAIRIPAWAGLAMLTLDGKPVAATRQGGYAHVARRWRAGERLELSLPMDLRAEPIPGDPTTVAFLSGPLVLAADLGPAATPFDAAAPALLVEGEATGALQRTNARHQFTAQPLLGDAVMLKPFFGMYDRRTAVYFKTFTPAAWAAGKDDYLAAEAARADLVRRTVDIFHIGEMQPERDHGFTSTNSSAGQFYGRSCRRLPPGQSMRFRMARRPGPAILRVTYWGDDVDRVAEISVDGTTVATERRAGPGKSDWVTIDYPLPPVNAADCKIAFAARAGDTVVYGVRIIIPPPAALAT